MLLFFLMFGGLYLAFPKEVRLWALLITTRNTAKKIVAQACEGKEPCVSEMRSAMDSCPRLAIGDSTNIFKGADRAVLTHCLERRILIEGCKGENKCLVVLDGLFDKCFRIVFTDTASLGSADSHGRLSHCIQTKSYLVDVK